MTLTTKIRFNAAMRVRVKITRRRRSKTGFLVYWPSDEPGKALTSYARTFREAEAMLLAKVRTFNRLEFGIK